MIGRCLCTVAVVLAMTWSKRGQPQELPKIENSVGMQLNLLPAGRFEMGKLSEGVFAKDHAEFNIEDDKRHPVVITRPFYLATTEVTRTQFGQFLADTGHKPSSLSK